LISEFKSNPVPVRIAAFSHSGKQPRLGKKLKLEVRSAASEKTDIDIPFLKPGVRAGS
jgi:hypothetical protein